MKIITIVGTRPEIIRLSCTIKLLDKYSEHILVHTGQNYDYELNEIFFNDLGIRKPDFFLNAAGKNAIETIGQVIIKIGDVFDEVKPDAVLILGDTNSALCAITAKRKKIPIFHMEAGNRCFDQRVPEEINRKIVDHISDINLTYTSIAREYLLAEGFPADRIIKTGSPITEVINKYEPQISSSTVLQNLGLEKFDYFLVSAHREENIDSEVNFNNLINTLNKIAEKYNKRIIFSTHPRTRKKIEHSDVILHSNVELMKPLGYFDYVSLQIHAKVVLSDSGTITEESSVLNFPALNIRESHERPEGMEEASVIMTGISPERILESLLILNDQGRGLDGKRQLSLVKDYESRNVSEKVLRIILSYTDYVNRVVWRKH